MPIISKVMDDNNINIVSVRYNFGLIGYLMPNAVMIAFLPCDLSSFVDNELPTLPIFSRSLSLADYIDS